MAILPASITKDRRLPDSNSTTKTRSKGTTVIILWNSWATKHKLFLGLVEKEHKRGSDKQQLQSFQVLFSVSAEMTTNKVRLP